MNIKLNFLQFIEKSYISKMGTKSAIGVKCFYIKKSSLTHSNIRGMRGLSFGQQIVMNFSKKIGKHFKDFFLGAERTSLEVPARAVPADIPYS